MSGFNKEALKGLRVCVTGAISSVGTRQNVDRLIESAGGYADSSVNSATNLLVLGYKPGATKVKAAARLGIKTIDKDDFMAMLSTDSGDWVQSELDAKPVKEKEPTPEHYGDW